MKYLLMFFSVGAFACIGNGGNIVPETGMKIPVTAKVQSNITEEQFNNIIDRVEAIYSPIVETYGQKFVIYRNWNDGTVNASARRIEGGWAVVLYGGLARHKDFTEDALALSICHEIGHHLGGAPKFYDFFRDIQWASIEAQADYFATLKCLRKVFLHDDNIKIVGQMNIPAVVSEACSKNHSDKEDAAICMRSAMAGYAFGKFESSLLEIATPEFETPDPTVVSKTNIDYGFYPSSQCRLDTLFQGALCNVNFNEDVSDRDVRVGTCNKANGDVVGVRPACWFK